MTEPTDNGNPFRDDKMYNTAELAEIMAVSRGTIGVWEKAGRIPASITFTTMGKRWPGRHMIAWYDRQVEAQKSEGCDAV